MTIPKIVQNVTVQTVSTAIVVINLLRHRDATCTCAEGYTGSDCETEITACINEPCQNGGTCYSSSASNFTCECTSTYSGDNCEKYNDCWGKCQCNYFNCQNGGTCVQETPSAYSCYCGPEYTGNLCQTKVVTTTTAPDTSACDSITCENGGACVTDSDGTASCLCLSTWEGTYCQTFDNCQINETRCENGGTCYATGNTTFGCNCLCAYAGDTCTEFHDRCTPNPCLWGGTCSNVNCTYYCDCPPGTSGQTCSNKVNNCMENWINVCTTVDYKAVCTDELTGYSCTCSSLYTGPNCTMSIYVWNALQAFGTTDIVSLLEQVVSQPSLISDIIPFVLGQLSTEEQEAMSWDYDDLFLWAAYEKTELTQVDIIKSFDITLGNCFTFNHKNSSTQYYLRTAGKPGGFEALMRVQEDEYPAWIDTAALLIFPHDQGSTIFAESTRYNAAPSKSTTVITNKITYKLLGGVYGKCVKSASEVESYYYTGSYTTAGCLRACYQDAVNDACNCMDPRYAMPDWATSCSLDSWDCVNNVTTIKGDASEWSSCICPSPCSDVEFESSYALNTFVYYTAQCNYSSTGSCYADYIDAALISVYVPSLTHKVYAESPAMSFNQLISTIGGMGGVFLGISIVTFIEVVMLFILICRAFVCKSVNTLNKANE
uniref:EGF-like domain-containing protein n=1 Tax=Panagrellus redivivus TaxID=6233 RepID=A0A7E4WBA6_PANRE